MTLIRLLGQAFAAMLLQGWAQAQIESVGIAGDGQHTRITIASPQALDSTIRLTETEGVLGLDWITPNLAVRADAYLAAPVGGISAYTLQEDRISFEMDRPMMVARLLDVPPRTDDGVFRYVIDLSEVSPARFRRQQQRDAVSQPASPPVEAHARLDITGDEGNVISSPSFKPAGLADPDRQPEPFVIVIDPGHGGRDPGASSVIGGEEKEIVLKAAAMLAEELAKEPRYEVRLTRSDDTYVEHEDRVTQAREWGADLFISLHADAAGAASVQGASVYTISTRGESRINGAANKYGWEIPIETGTSETVSGILEDLVRRETKSNSAIFAELLLPELASAGPLVRNSHRQGNLFVLLAPDVPAVLIEIGFLTNRGDARRLASRSGRQRTARAIKRAIDAYFDQQELRLASN